MGTSKITNEEKEQILQWGKEGLGYTEIAEKLGRKISKQRVKQICARYLVDAAGIRKSKRELENAQRMTAKWGVNWDNKEHRRNYLYLAMREKYRTKKANSKRAGKVWDISFGDINFPTVCPILGIELDYFAERLSDNSPSFDCVIPEKGYVKGNVYVTSWRANRIKNDGTAEEHYAIASFIALVSEQL